MPDTVVEGYRHVPPLLPPEGGAFAGQELSIRRLSEHGYWMQLRGYQSTVVVGADSALLVDPPMGGRSEQVAVAVRSVFGREVSAIVYSHAHRDHISGAHEVIRASTWRGAIDIICSAACAVELGRLGNIPPPTTVLDDASNLFFEGIEVGVQTIGGHAVDSTLVLLPGEAVAHAVDLIHPGQAEYFSFGDAVSVAHYERAITRMAQLPWRVLTAGHAQLCWPADVRLLLDYLADLRTSTTAGLEFATQQIARETFGQPNERLARLRSRVRDTVRPGILARWRAPMPGLEFTVDSHIDRFIDDIAYYC